MSFRNCSYKSDKPGVNVPIKQLHIKHKRLKQEAKKRNEAPLKNQTSVERILVVKQACVIDVGVGTFSQRYVHSVKRHSSTRIWGSPSQTYEIPNQRHFIDKYGALLLYLNDTSGIKTEILPLTLCFPLGSFVMCEAFLSSCLKNKNNAKRLRYI